MGEAPWARRKVVPYGSIRGARWGSRASGRKAIPSWPVENYGCKLLFFKKLRVVPVDLRLGFYTFPGLILTMDGVRPDNQNYPFRTLFA